MNSKLFIGISLLAIGVIVGWFILGDSPTVSFTPKKSSDTANAPLTPSSTPRISPQSTDQNSYPVAEKGGGVARSLVTYTDTGFSPSPLVVKKGMTVVFVNESNGSMQVASAPYLSHTILPTFVQKNQVNKGGSYEYTFTAIGTWKYQNDAKAVDTGSIVVTE